MPHIAGIAERRDPIGHGFPASGRDLGERQAAGRATRSGSLNRPAISGTKHIELG